jgi:diguanylate cyclase (GGDEF)-like protein
MNASANSALIEPGRSDRRRAALEAVIVALLMVTVVAVAVGEAWSHATTAARENYQAHLVSLARAGALQMDASLHGLIRQPEQIDGPVYRRAIEPLRSMKAALPEVRYLYTIVSDGDDVRFILDSAEPGDHDGDGVEDRSGVWDVSRSRQQAKRVALGMLGEPPRPAATPEPYTDDWGTFMSGYAPFFDTRGRLAGAVGVDVDATGYVAQVDETRRETLAGLVPAGLLIVALGFGVYRQRFASFRATRQIADAAQAAREASRRDRLTGLANRTALVEELDAAFARMRSGQQRCCAVFFLDFDHFKFINDTLGHDAGDELLRQISQRLRRALIERGTGCGPRNVVARFGGDEFVVLLNELVYEADVPVVAAALLAALAPVYELKGSEVRSSASIGVRTCDDAGLDAETALHHADVAMYQAKASGRACFVQFDAAMEARLARRRSVEAQLLRAAATAELSIEYAPIVELDSGRRVGIEAALQWNHPQFVDLSRREIMEIAEESGLVATLGDWTLREACRQLGAWRRAAPEQAPCFVSVGLSRAEIALGPRLLDAIRGALAAAGLSPECLQLEIPERVATDPRGSVATVLEALRTLGVRLSMGGFGTGSSSLSVLRSHAFDAVKITPASMQGLASNRDALALAHATLTLVENLGMASIAAGVDDPAQLAVLQSLGCRYAQGAIFQRYAAGPPVSAAAPTAAVHAA